MNIRSPRSGRISKELKDRIIKVAKEEPYMDYIDIAIRFGVSPSTVRKYALEAGVREIKHPTRGKGKKNAKQNQVS